MRREMEWDGVSETGSSWAFAHLQLVSGGAAREEGKICSRSRDPHVSPRAGWPGVKIFLRELNVLVK